MSRDRRRSPLIESLEGKQLLSAIPHHLPVDRPPAAQVRPASLPIGGALAAATYSTRPTTPMSETVTLPFFGDVGTMGAVKATMTEVVNESVEAVSGGDIVLKNARGSVTLAYSRVNVLENLTSPAGYNSEFLANYQIAGGTGAYAGSTGRGVIEVTTDVTDPIIHLALSPTEPVTVLRAPVPKGVRR